MYKLIVFNSGNEIQYQVFGFASIQSANDYATDYCVDGPPGWYYKIVPVE